MNILNKFTLLVTGICLVAMTAAGCGKKEPADVAPKAEVQETEKAETPSTQPITEERTYYSFEQDMQGWEVPMWAANKSDYVASDLAVSTDYASNGSSSLKMMVDFPGGMWSAGLVEIQQYLNLSAYRVLRADIFVPEGVAPGLKAKIILTVGNNWKFVEMNQDIPLVAGEWVTVTGNIEPGSYDWKRIVPDKSFAEDVRKISIRIVSNRQPKYAGPIYIDNIRVGR